MTQLILDWSIEAAQLILSLAMVCAFIRLVCGPRAQDRVVALDAFYTATMLVIVTFGMRSGMLFYFEAAFVIGLLGFVSSLALAKFLMRGEVIE